MIDSRVTEAVGRAATKHGTPEAVVTAVLVKMLPSIRLVAQPANAADLPLGGCRIGGRPDLPRSMTWPRRSDAAGEDPEAWEPDLNGPLQFILQVNLAVAAPFDVGHLLPTTGLLSFFYYGDEYTDPGDEVAYILLSRVKGLHRAEIPDDLPVEQRYRSRELRPCVEWTVPSIEDSGVEGDHWSPDFPHFGFWRDLEEMVADAQGLENPHRAASVIHRLLGHPQLIQSPGLADGTKLLLQADSDASRSGRGKAPATGMMWGDSGRLYYLIGEAALKAQRLTEKPWVTVEMC
jgi:uncharacterized protein YwqG